MMGTVHIIICNPKGKKEVVHEFKFMVNGREVSGDTDVK